LKTIERQKFRTNQEIYFSIDTATFYDPDQDSLKYQSMQINTSDEI
jgi:hypothetical protein